MSLGERIRFLRAERNMSQTDLAELLRVSRQSVSKWETDGATPDLDKLVSMSQVFGVTLDELIKGSAPIPEMQVPAESSSPAPDTKKATASHRIVGIILLCFGALIAILLFFLGGDLISIVFASPFLLCGIICLFAHSRTGLWCWWGVYLCVDLYLRYGTGITWSIIMLTPQFTPEMNYMRLAIGWGQFLAGVLLIVLTLWSYRKNAVACDKKHMILAGTELLLLVGLTFAQNGTIRAILSRPNAHEPLYQDLCFWVNSCGDYIRLWLLVALLVLGSAQIRQRRMDHKT